MTASVTAIPQVELVVGKVRDPEISLLKSQIDKAFSKNHIDANKSEPHHVVNLDSCLVTVYNVTVPKWARVALNKHYCDVGGWKKMSVLEDATYRIEFEFDPAILIK